MSDWQRAEMARFDADKADRPGDDMRVGEAIYPAPKCPECCETEVEYSDDICEGCLREMEAD
jgi:hypothetical protein